MTSWSVYENVAVTLEVLGLPAAADPEAMIESTAIYCFVVAMILLFANPFWNHMIAAATGK